MISPLRVQATGLLALLLITTPFVAQTQRIEYRLTYSGAGDHRIAVSITFPQTLPQPVAFVVPRNYPGGYGLVLYDSFVENVRAFSTSQNRLSVKKEADAPRWDVDTPEERVARIEYEVDIDRMEYDIHAAIDSSKVRSGYLGILGYSVFGYVDGLEDRPIELKVEAPKDWPVLTTLSPSVPASTGTTSAVAESYYALADSQILMGPNLQLRSFNDGALILAAYVEGEADLDVEGQLAAEALDKVAAYFGNHPFSTYTVQLELLHPLSVHDYGFSQEHLNSGTFSFSIDKALTIRSTAQERQGVLFNYAHHIAHCWIPKRTYGIGYMPFTWESPPVIDTIWFNEGFARYAAIEALAEEMAPSDAADFRRRELGRLRKILDDAPPFIRDMPLLVLSREASFMYSLDFRFGMNTFARGALMAAEIDNNIRSRTNGKKGLRDGMRFLLDWSAKNHRAFKTEELGALLSQSTGTDLSEIIDRWMQPNPK